MAKQTALIKCACKHDWQDKQYGQQIRVANATAKGDQQSREVRCTVCSATHRVPVERLR